MIRPMIWRGLCRHPYRSYGQISAGNGTATYESFGSLPRDPAALDAYLERKPGANAPAQVKTNAAFASIDYMLEFLVRRRR